MLDNLAKFYGISIDEIVHPDNEVPTDVVIEDKTADEQMRLLLQLEEEDKQFSNLLIKCLPKRNLKTFSLKM